MIFSQLQSVFRSNYRYGEDIYLQAFWASCLKSAGVEKNIKGSLFYQLDLIHACASSKTVTHLVWRTTSSGIG